MTCIHPKIAFLEHLPRTELPEDFVVFLSPVSPASLVNSDGMRVTISDNDPPASTPTVSVSRTSPWSWNARTVSSGIVFTVSEPISSSTYITSRYSGFFVDVEAQRHRCVLAPFASSADQRGSFVALTSGLQGLGDARTWSEHVWSIARAAAILLPAGLAAGFVFLGIGSEGGFNPFDHLLLGQGDCCRRVLVCSG